MKNITFALDSKVKSSPAVHPIVLCITSQHRFNCMQFLKSYPIRLRSLEEEVFSRVG